MTSKSSQKSGSHASGGYQYSMSLGVKAEFKMKKNFNPIFTGFWFKLGW
jgi:hypothetical protein